MTGHRPLILFDALPLQASPSRVRGIGRYAANLLQWLKHASSHWDLRLLTHGYLPPPDDTLVDGFRVHEFVPPLRVVPHHVEAIERYYADWIAQLHPDWVLHSSLFEADGMYPQYSGQRVQTAVVLYDLIPILFPHHYGLNHPNLGWYARRFRDMARADRLLSISEATAADTRRLLGTDCPPITTIGGASSERDRATPDEEVAALEQRVRSQYGLRQEYVLFVGGGDARKNSRGAFAAFAALPPEIRDSHDLVVACRLEAPARTLYETEAQEFGITDHVIFTGYVPDDVLRTLYQGCRALLFPSYYEGLGLPVLEALQHGAPVVAANTGGLPEYAGAVSWLCDPASQESIARALLGCLREPRDLRRVERQTFADSFRWDDVAARTIAALETHVPAIPAFPRRPRIAWVSPAPPSATGVADYALEVAEALADRFELEWVADPLGPLPDPSVTRPFRLILADEFDARHRAQPFDLPVYHVGNNGMHGYILPLLSRHPGLVILHDAHVGGLFRTAHDTQVWPGSWSEELRHNGEWLMADWLDRGLVHPHITPSLIGLNRRVVDLAAGLVVHSRAAWQKARTLTDAPVSVIPHIAIPPTVGTREAERRRLGMPRNRFVVCTLGIVSPTKRPDVILRTVSRLPQDIRSRSHVLIVGPIAESEQTALTQLSHELGLDDHVEIRGKVPLDDFPVFAYAADVCVQLRYPSNGETSGALSRALAAGAACVTSDMPTMCDLPNTVTWKVRSPLRDTDDLARILLRLARNPAERDRLAANAQQYMIETASPAAVAARYAAAINDSMARGMAQDMPWRTAVQNALADIPGDIPPGLIEDWVRLRHRSRVQPEVPSQPRTRVA